MDNKARIKSAFSTIDSMEPEDILRVVLEEKRLPNERKALMLDTASAKYKTRARTQGVWSESREDPSELFARKFKLNENYMQTFRFLVQGLSDKDIAKELGLSVNTVHNQVKRILAKTEKNRRYELMALGYEWGFSPKPQS
jgi:DNA-binding NarL/FixJ family response regulator